MKCVRTMNKKKHTKSAKQKQRQGNKCQSKLNMEKANMYIRTNNAEETG